MDIPHSDGLLYLRFPLWPEFPPEEERLNRDFSLPVRDGQKEETLCFRLAGRSAAQTVRGTPCTEYRGYGRLSGYKTAEMSLLISAAEPFSAAVILKLYPDPEDPRWEPYSRWSAAGPE